MRRRHFIQLGAKIAAILAAYPVRAQNGSLTRGAVVIGVDRPHGLPPLKAAASGAKSIADWLRNEDFKVKLFLDDQNPVRFDDIYQAVVDFVNQGTLDQLVVYFAGHGFVEGYSEFWLLSDAPDNPNQAISFNECVELAKDTGIPNVVFISDACRSTLASLGAQRVRGSLMFPNRPARGQRSKVDKFLATLVGDPAYEVPVSDTAPRYEGLYTSCFLDAYAHPDASMVANADGGLVVPNRKMVDYLAREVPKRIHAKANSLEQIPDAEVLSDAYIGHAHAPGPGYAIGPVKAFATIHDVASFELEQIGAIYAGAPRAVTRDAINSAAESTGFARSRDTILSTKGPTTFQNNTGINVFGTIVSAAAGSKVKAKILARGDGKGSPSSIEIDPGNEPAGTVGLQFEQGSGTVVAALKGFVANIVVDRTGVANVSYTQANGIGLSSIDSQRLDQLHAAVATAAKYGVFRIDGPPDMRTRNAAQLGDSIRVLKSVDPTLGIYASYAYAEADLLDDVHSVRNILRGQLGVDLFDVLLLAGELSGKPTADLAVVPFCPMLSQGWGQLRVKNVSLPRELGRLRDHLLPALWSTFDSEGIGMMMSALATGDLR